MQQDILIIGVLFPAIPLMMVNFGNRYPVLANLVRHLRKEVIRGDISATDAKRSSPDQPSSRQATPDWHHPEQCRYLICHGTWRNDCCLF